MKFKPTASLWAFSASLAGLLIAGVTPVNASTKAYWRFETGPVNTDILSPAGGPNWSADVPDSSGSGNDLVYGNGGADTISAGAGDDTVTGGAGADILYGNQGNDLLYGNMGDDIIFGGAGDDTIDGGKGNDTLTGNAGADLFVFGTNSGADIVQGFSFAEGDRLNLQGQSFTQGTAADGSIVLTLSGGGSITLAGVTTFNAGFVV